MYFLIDDMLIMNELHVWVGFRDPRTKAIMYDPQKYSSDTRFIVCSADSG